MILLVTQKLSFLVWQDVATLGVPSNKLFRVNWSWMDNQPDIDNEKYLQGAEQDILFLSSEEQQQKRFLLFRNLEGYSGPKSLDCIISIIHPFTRALRKPLYILFYMGKYDSVNTVFLLVQ